VSPRKRSPKRPAAGGGRSSSRAVVALAVMGAIVAAYGWNAVFLGPRNAARAKVHTELSDARQKEQDLRQNMAQLRKLAADTQSREAELARLGRLVPADADLAGAILALDETAKQAQVSMGSLIPSPPAATAGGGPATLGVTMTIDGTFDQIYDYLSRIETLDRLVVIDSLQLAGGGGNGTGNGPGSGPAGPLKLGAQIKARLFAATGPAAPATSAAPAAGASNNPDTSKTAALPKAGG
jgi:type IV pilus assembly protein PilO